MRGLCQAQSLNICFTLLSLQLAASFSLIHMVNIKAAKHFKHGKDLAYDKLHKSISLNSKVLGHVLQLA